MSHDNQAQVYGFQVDSYLDESPTNSPYVSGGFDAHKHKDRMHDYMQEFDYIYSVSERNSTSDQTSVPEPTKHPKNKEGAGARKRKITKKHHKHKQPG